MAEKQTNKQRLKEITDSIEANIQELFQSERYMNYLRTMSRFHKYSFNNTMLIHMQKPDATLVTGYSKWEQKFNRHVKRGEKGIKIIAPTPFKKKIEQEKLDPDTKLPLRDKDGNIIMEEKEVKIPMFKPVVVFDVSQTEGEPLPTLSSDLRGDVKHYEIFMEALRRSSPVPMELKAISGDMDGFFNLDDQSITIREGMSEVQTICAAVHEITHAKLHNIKDGLKLDDKEKYAEITLFDKPALFSDGRIDRDKLPEGLFCYDLRGSGNDPGEPVSVENRVVVNHAGSVILAEPLDFGEDGYLSLGDDMEHMNFLSGDSTLKHFYEQTHPEKVKKDRNTEEVEAESVSFAVCCYYGIETGENSFGYIASWSDGMELKELRASLETINRTADGLITDIDRNFTEICKERGIDLSNEQVGASVLPGDSVGGGEMREAQPNEQFYRVNEAQYLYIQRCDTGYDYTFYDAASKRALDGGQLDNPGLSIAEAAKAVCELNEALMDDMTAVAGELPEDFTESAPRDYRAELADHFSKEDERLWDTDTKLDEYPMPDKNYDSADLAEHGLYDESFLPISKELAAEMIDRDLTVYAVTSEGAVMAFDREEVESYQDGSLFAVLREEWEQTAEFKDAVADRMNHQQERETAFLDHAGDSFAIYQLKGGEETRDLRYEPLPAQGVDKKFYELAYTAPLPDGATLDTLWDTFNTAHPAGYLRPSMSVSDIVAIRKDGVLSCHYVDRLAFTELHGFLQPENYLKSAEVAMEDDYNMVDGIINNGPKQPTVAELEEQAKSGQPISLYNGDPARSQDLVGKGGAAERVSFSPQGENERYGACDDAAGAIQREKEEKQQKPAPGKKPSILAKIRKPLPARGDKKTAPERSAEKEYTR